MKYFTAWFNPPIKPEYERCLLESKKIVPDIEIWTSFPEGYPFEWKKDEPLFHTTDKFRIWMLANYYTDGAIWFDMDAVIKKRYEIPENTIMTCLPFQQVGWLDCVGPGYLTINNHETARDAFLILEECTRKMQRDQNNLDSTIFPSVASNLLDLWAVGHNKRPGLFKEIVNWLLEDEKNQDKIFGIHEYVGRMWEREQIKLFPLGYFRHYYFTAFPEFSLKPMLDEDFSNIEIDITYKCNLGCVNCNRFCGIAPSEECMTIEQIHKFVKQSISNNIMWKKIRVIGGEPTLHKDVIKILGILRKGFPSAFIQLVTNGFWFGNFDSGKISKDWNIDIENSKKIVNFYDNFAPISVAPRDFPEYKWVEFSEGVKQCFIATFCGMGLSPFGYYPCAVAGAIDRVLGFDLGAKTIPSLLEREEMCKILCSFCGHCFGLFFPKNVQLVEKILKYKNSKGDFVSPSWQEAFLAYEDSKPILTLY